MVNAEYLLNMLELLGNDVNIKYKDTITALYFTSSLGDGILMPRLKRR